MNAPSENLAARHDVAYHLHPNTDLAALGAEGPFVVSRGEGVYVFDEAGRRYIEGMAGLWCVGLGFSEPRLIEAADRQLRTLPCYHAFSGKVSTVAAHLAGRLIGLAPEGLVRVFFANSGSEANDSAVKLVWYYNNALGRPAKKKIIARKRGYHGVTVAAGSLTGLAAFHAEWDLPLPRMLHVETPHYWRGAREGESEQAYAARLARELEETIVAQGPDTVAAFIAEPIMGAGGVILPPETYFEQVQAVLAKYDVLMIADEVICGFGRTGRMFGSHTYGIRPDILTCAKMLTSGYVPMSAVMVSQPIYDALLEQSKKLGMLAHGFTYSGHPLASAVALETLAIYEERDLLAHVRSVAPVLQDGLRAVADHPLVGEARGIGLIGAWELVRDKATKASFDPKAGVGAHLVRRAQEHGAIVRVVSGDMITFSPPLVIDAAQIRELLACATRALDDTWDWVRANGLA
ncbi:MAG: aspartate aminotransferase family protein [Burkholderiales bacterium]|nr:MAG: aspartate aminotransferase family protein [Burkholderiales bacterium]